MEITLFYITTPDEETAHKLSDLALDQQLAACSNIFPIQCGYDWKGVRTQDKEYVLILKTLSYLQKSLQTMVLSNHPYETPCIINWNVEVNESYGEWIRSLVKKEPT